MELLAKIANTFYPWTIFAKCIIMDAWQGSKYASGEEYRVNINKIERFKPLTANVSLIYRQTNWLVSIWEGQKG